MIIEYTQPRSEKRLEQTIRIKDFVPPTWDNHFDRVEKFLDDYNIDVNYDIISELVEVQDEFPYKWLQVPFILERFDIYVEDLEELK